MSEKNGLWSRKRLLSKLPLSEVAGILSNNETKELEAGVKKVRKSFKLRKGH